MSLKIRLTSMRERYVYIGIIGILIATIFLLEKCNDREKADLLNEIAKQSGIIREADGRYAQLVSVIPKQSDLVAALKESIIGEFDDIRGLLRTIKQNNERMLAFTTTYSTFRGQKDSVLIFTADPRTGADWQFKLLYPDTANPFIEYSGLIFPQTRQIAGDWRFNRLPLSFILTETQRGNWNARVVGPDYFIVDSIITRALPPDKIAERRRFGFVAGVGGGYNFRDSSPVFSVAVGARIKQMRFLLSGSTQSDVQVIAVRDF